MGNRTDYLLRGSLQPTGLTALCQCQRWIDYLRSRRFFTADPNVAVPAEFDHEGRRGLGRCCNRRSRWWRLQNHNRWLAGDGSSAYIVGIEKGRHRRADKRTRANAHRVQNEDQVRRPRNRSLGMNEARDSQNATRTSTSRSMFNSPVDAAAVERLRRDRRSACVWPLDRDRRWQLGGRVPESDQKVSRR